MSVDTQYSPSLFESPSFCSAPEKAKTGPSLQTTPKLPKRERLASLSRLVHSENFTDLMPEKVTTRKNRNSVKKINWNSEIWPQIRVFSSSPKKDVDAYTEMNDDLFNFKDIGTPRLKPLPFSPNFVNLSPEYTSPMYQQTTPMRSPLYISDIKGGFLGRGAFGNVTLCTHKGKKFALKVIDNRALFIGERNFVSLRHPHLVSILHVANAFNKVYICMEFAGHCNLQQILDTKSELDYRRLISFTVQVALGLRHCHQRQIVHGDIKPANVIVSPYGICKLGDFGHSINLKSISKARVSSRQKVTGTAAYAAPEILRGAQPTLPSDMYSFGILLWQVQTRELPFAGEHPHVIIYKVAAHGIRPDFNNCIPISEDYENTAECCWKEDPEERLNISEVLQKLKAIERVLKKS